MNKRTVMKLWVLLSGVLALINFVFLYYGLKDSRTDVVDWLNLVAGMFCLFMGVAVYGSSVD